MQTAEKRNQDKPVQEKQEKQEANTKEMYGKTDKDWRFYVNFEAIYKSITILVVALIPFFLHDMYKFRQYCDEQGLKYQSWNFVLYGCISAVCLTFYRQWLGFKLLYSFVFKNISEKFVGKDREVRAIKVVKWIIDIIYYVVATIYACVCFRHKQWFPLDMKSDWYNQGFMEQWPDKLEIDVTPYMEFYLFVQFGQHIYALLELCTRKSTEVKFYEWLLHHVLAFTLIFYSVYNNFYVPGVIILIIHDVGDIFLAWFKVYGVFRTDFFFYLNTFNMIISWFITRIYIYPKGIILPFIDYFKQLYLEVPEDGARTYTQASYIYMLVLTLLLQMMHLYWFGTMLTMLTKHLKQIVSSTKKVKFQNDFDFHQKNFDKKSKQVNE